ncbi:NADPH-dependent FMN reductase [Salinigranum rubrum]|uniref:NADPH-dependent FMN reductase n=1 Tax=Salinigranum rubrum TaxID=755307 RepID=A0A2I8VHN3_9EURY|nr:NAD(P)H-dependent oxidoreductase [Salinigranum rubrum]AUV81404.1 NADPH-dependent FMN reductase [Salinigranum rubrum]
MSDKTEPRVVAICGSLRDNSRTRVALGEALTASEEAGATTELIDLRDHELPSLNAVNRDVPGANTLRKTVNRADSVLLGTPNYHGSYSGALKNALDYCGRDQFTGTTVGLLEVAAGDFPGSALIHLRAVSRSLRAWTLPTEVAIPDSPSVVDERRITDSDIAERIHRLGQELTFYAGMSDYPEQTKRIASAGIDSRATDSHMHK